jgi:hypothetical protein
MCYVTSLRRSVPPIKENIDPGVAECNEKTATIEISKP